MDQYIDAAMERHSDLCHTMWSAHSTQEAQKWFLNLTRPAAAAKPYCVLL